jgi:type I restriction enzyme, S subunit
MFRRVKDVGHPDEEMLSVFREHGVIPKASRENLNQTAENRDIYQLVHPGWLVVNRMKAWQGSVGISGLRGILSGHYICFEPHHDENPSYLNWLLRSPLYAQEFQRLSRGVRPGQQEIDNEQLRLVPITVPDRQRQDLLVVFLDRETTRIDRLIAEQLDLLDVFDERRSALIADRVRHPVEQPVSHHFAVVLGKMLDGARAPCPDDVVLPYLRAANVQDNGLWLESINEMPFTGSERVALDLRAGDLLVVEGGAIGTCYVLTDDMPGMSFQKTLNRVRSRGRGSTRFLAYVIRSMRDAGYLDVVCNKSTIPHLTAEKLLALRVPQPPIDEQERIVSLLDAETAKIDRLAAQCVQLITLLTERRSALITAAVTGKIDVRGVDTPGGYPIDLINNVGHADPMT